ncbi:MAG: hypothetical protein QNJ23_10980 [Woeseiaceae bacterium]|nr:hypothetical protein [Woeseiaceae bacterium]
MRYSIALVLLVAGFAMAEDETAVPSANDWYKSEYATLYGDKPWDKVDELVSHFSESVHDHDDGQQYNTHEWLSGGIEEWKIDGWIRSELANLDVDQLNPSTATFKAKWRDYYSGGNISYECGWYLADMVEGKWLITEYATIACGEHGL